MAIGLCIEVVLPRVEINSRCWKTLRLIILTYTFVLFCSSRCFTAEAQLGILVPGSDHQSARTGNKQVSINLGSAIQVSGA